MHKLQNKLLTNNVIPIKIFNQLHPKQNVHLKSSEHKQEKIKVVQAESPVRKKREVVIHPQTQPEMVMQPNIQPALLQQAEARVSDTKLQCRNQVYDWECNITRRIWAVVNFGV